MNECVIQSIKLLFVQKDPLEIKLRDLIQIADFYEADSLEVSLFFTQEWKDRGIQLPELKKRAGT